MLELEARHLAAKIDLLRQRRFNLDAVAANPCVATQDDLVREWSRAAGAFGQAVSAVDAAAWVASGRLPERAARALLTLFGVASPTGADESERTGHPAELWRGTVDAFCAQVRLAGGAAGSEQPGVVWDRFLQSQQHASGTGAGLLAVRVVHSVPRRHSSRLRPHSPMSMPADNLPLLWAGDRVAFEIRLPSSILAAGTEPVHLLLFHDVYIDGVRRFVPLFPAPHIPGYRFPAMPTRAPVLNLPEEASPQHCLLVPPHWGPLRQLVGIATRRPLDLDLLHEALTGPSLQPARIDLLAARFNDRTCWPPDEYAVWQSSYRVVLTAQAARWSET